MTQLSFTELSAVYAKVQLGDNRKSLDEALAQEWMDTLRKGGVEYMDAIAAVTEFRATQPGKYLEPGHIVQIARRLRQDRADAAHHQQLASGPKVGAPKPANYEAMVAAYRAHDLAYVANLELRTSESQAALDAAYGEVCAEEAAYNRQLMEAGVPPVDNPISVYGMQQRGGLWS